MTVIRIVVDCLLVAYAVASIALIVRLRRRIHSYESERAQRVAEALAGACYVDGMTLPLPTDKQWRAEDREFTRSDKISPFKEKTLVCGVVLVTRGELYIGWGSGVKDTGAVRRYVETVWREYHSRIVRESLEKGNQT